MQSHDPPDWVVIEINQRCEGHERLSLGDSTAVLIHALRSQEAQDQNLFGQDYVRLVARRDGSRICFCVCDGVGSSYRGDFAAHYLGERLANWMVSLDAVPGQLHVLQGELQSEMARWSAAAQDELVSTDRPLAGGSLEREVLRELRNEYGSETVFLAGRIDLAPSMSAGIELSETSHLFLCWMGNVRTYLCSGSQRQLTLVCADDDWARWSTVRGPRGEVRMRRITTTTPWRLVVHTDGFAMLGDAILTMSEDDIMREELRLLKLPTSDDMTLLTIERLARLPVIGDLPPSTASMCGQSGAGDG